jgi:hypothetical protein
MVALTGINISHNTRRGASSALCLPLLPAGNSNLCGGRT